MRAHLQEQQHACHCHATNLQNHFCGDALINLIDKMAQGPAPRSPSPCLRMRALSLTLEVVQYSAADALARTPACMALPCNNFASPLLWRRSDQSHAGALVRTTARMPLPRNEFAKPLLWRTSDQSHPVLKVLHIKSHRLPQSPWLCAGRSGPGPSLEVGD